MAASTEQKLDYLLKKIGYTASKTGVAEDETGISGSPTKKAPFAESIPSPLTLPGANVWAQSNQIPTTPPGANTSIVRVYKTGTAQQLTFDNTVSGNRSFVARETAGEVTSTVVGDWIDTQFGADYIVKVYKGDPNAGGTQVSAAGSTGNDTWFFDYSAGVLNFNGTNIPSGITTTNIYIEGYRYTGIKGVTGVAQTFTDLEISGITTFNGAVDMNSTLDVDGDTQLDDLNVSGVTTFSGAVDIIPASGFPLTLQASNSSIPAIRVNNQSGTQRGQILADDHLNIEATGNDIILNPNSGGGTSGNIRFKTGNGSVPDIVSFFATGGVGIAGTLSATGVNVSGVVTATTFSGNLATTDLTGTITNAQLAGSIANDKLSNSTVSYGGISLALGGTDATPAFDLSDATNYPFTSLTGITTSIVGDTTPTLGGNLDGNSKSIFGVGILTATGDGTFDDIRVGQWLGNADYAGVFHKNQTGNEYMLLSQDDHTFVSASTGHDVVIRGGNNTNTNNIRVTPDSDGIQISGNTTFNNDINVTGNVSIGGTLTYEDVTNIDSVGLITARTGIKVLAGGINAVGVVTANSFDGSLATTNLTGTITNAQLAGSIANDKLANSTVSYGGVSLALGGTDATPAFNLTDATNYPFTSLTGITTTILGDATPKLGGDLNGNGKSIFNVGIITATTFSGDISGVGATFTSITGTLITAAQTNITSVGTLGALTVSGDINANGNIVGDNATNISGINSVTATTFVGALTGTASTSNTVSVSDESTSTNCFPLFAVASVSSGLIQSANLAPKAGSNLSFDSANGNLVATKFTGSTVVSTGHIEQISASGISTFSGSLDVDGHTNLDDVNVSGASTFAGNINANGNIVGDSATNISGINSVTATTFYGDGQYLTGIAGTTGTTIFENITVSGNAGIGSLNVTGISTFAGNINANGKIGIGGTTIPQAKLDVEGTGTLAKFGTDSEQLFIKNNVAGYPAITNESSHDTIELRSQGSVQASIDYNNNQTDKYFRVVTNGQGGGGTELFRVQEDGKVGIGLTNPATKLDVHTTTQGEVARFRASNASRYLKISSFNAGYHGSGFDFNATSSGGALSFSVTNDEKLRITKQGKVGIGTTSPESLLSLYTDADGEELLHFDMGSVADRRGWKFKQGSTGTATQLVLQADGNGKVFQIKNSSGDEQFYVYTASSGGYVRIDPELHISDYIKHVGDHDTNIRFPADNTFTVETAGSERLRITSDGNVGIGTDNPNITVGSGNTAVLAVGIVSAYKLYGDGSNLTNVSVGVTENVATKGLVVAGVSTFYDNSIIDGSLTVGSAAAITGGAPTDEGNLAVYGTGKNSLIIQTTDNNTDRGIAWRNSGDAYVAYINAENRGSNTADLVFGVNNTTNSSVDSVPERMRITKEGNVGVGTANPTTTLEVVGSAVTVYNAAKNAAVELGSGRIELSRTDSVSYIDFKTGSSEDFDCRIQQYSNGLRFYTGGQGSTDERLRIASDGKVGINSSAPGAKLDVNGGLNVTGISTFGGNINIELNRVIKFYQNQQIVATPGVLEIESYGSNHINIKSNAGGGTTGNVYIRSGVTTIFEVHGDKVGATLTGILTATNISAIGGNFTGVVTATDFDATSDIRLKTNVKPIDDPIAKVVRIDGVSFNWKKDNRPALGVIADQVEKVLPQLVHGDDPKTVNYNGLVGLLIEVVKDQQKQIDSLNDRISKLE